MTEFSHFYSRYGQAILYDSDTEDLKNVIKELLQSGLDNFRLVASDIEKEGKTKYHYKNLENNSTAKGEFLAPHITTNNKSAKALYTYTNDLITNISELELSSSEQIRQRIAPSVGEYNNGRGRHVPKSTLEEAICCLLTTLSLYKPCISPKDDKGVNINYCIIPDLPVKDLQSFISLYKRMSVTGSTETLFYGDVKKDAKNKKQLKPHPPEIYNGNFPNPPRSSYLASIGVIASIAEWAKEAKLTTWANEVLDSLKGATLYLITYGDAKPFTYNHYVIDLAKDGKLRKVIDSIFYTQLFEKSRWNYSSKEDQIEYKKFDMFASRFLQLFNRPAFKDFLAFRAEYPYQLEILFTTYFTKMENIPIQTVQSAKELGRWLNYVAYRTAKAEHPNTKTEDFRKTKEKVLVEIESSVFSAKSGDALIAQVVTRAGRLSQLDAPPEADVFIEQTCSGELLIDNAKNLLMAFSRLRNKYEKPIETEEVENETEEDEGIDTSEYNEE